MESKKAYSVDSVLEESFAKVNLSEIYPKNEYVHLNLFKLFAGSFNTIPNFRFERNIDCSKASVWFIATYHDFIKMERYVQMETIVPTKRIVFEMFCFLYNDLIVHIDPGWSRINLLYCKTEKEKVEELILGFQKFKKRKGKVKPEISILVNTQSGIEVETLKIEKPKLKLDDNYNDDLIEFHRYVVQRLSKKDDRGLLILHGKPGTGKTFYLRHLITSVKKSVFFLSSNMIKSITNPDLVSVLIANPNSIIVIEDAEDIVMDREVSGDSPVSALLNISDGLISDCLNIQVICTFNTTLSKVDKALMRKGRLIGRYEFKELEAEKAQRLSDKLGFCSKITRPMTLTDIYNQNEKEVEHLKKDSYIGFKSVNFN